MLTEICNVVLCPFILSGFLQSSQTSEVHPRGRENPVANQPANRRVSGTFPIFSVNSDFVLIQFVTFILNRNRATGKWGTESMFCLCRGSDTRVMGNVMRVLGVCRCSRLEIMEQMAVLQETSYELLYRWAQSEFTAQSQYSDQATHCTKCPR